MKSFYCVHYCKKFHTGQGYGAGGLKRCSNLGRIRLLIRFLKSTHNQMLPFFLGTNTIGCTDAVGFVSCSIMPCSSIVLSSSFSLGIRGTAAERDPLVATWMAPSFNTKWYGGNLWKFFYDTFLILFFVLRCWVSHFACYLWLMYFYREKLWQSTFFSFFLPFHLVVWIFFEW